MSNEKISKPGRVAADPRRPAAQQKYKIRQAVTLPLLNQYKTWLDKSALQVPPKTTLGKALGYSLNQWRKLVRYVNDGNLTIDNNHAERAIKPFVIGRKNWLFSNAKSGANASAILYSIIETAKARGLTPFDYIMHCLKHLAASPSNVEALLPWNVKSGKV